MKKKVALLALSLALIAAIFSYGFSIDSKKKESPPLTGGTGIKVGQNLTSFTLVDVYGSTITVVPSGKIMVIHFWATWCSPCREEMSEMNQFAQLYREKIDFYGINLQEPSGKIRDFMSENNYTMPVLVDENGEVANIFKVTTIPTMIIVNKHGMIKYRKSGAMTRNELEGIINSL